MRLIDASVKVPCYILPAMPRVLTDTEFPDSLSKTSIGERITAIRRQRGLTQSELADRLGIARVLVSDYERGKVRLYGDMLGKLAVALDVSTDELLGFSNNERVAERPSLKVVKRMQRIEELPPAQQKLILRSLDMMIDSAQRSDD
jgi:transcriptional regulator with XRE-family HTH domain